MRLCNTKEQAFFGKLALSKSIFYCLFVSLFFCMPPCIAKELSGDELSQIVEFQLPSILLQVSDEESQSFIQSLIDDPDLLRNDEIYSRFEKVRDRVLLLMNLEIFTVNEAMTDEALREKVERWQQNPCLLDDEDENREAQEVILLFKRGSELLLQLHLRRMGGVRGVPHETPEEDPRISQWLENPSQVMSDAGVQEEIGRFLTDTFLVESDPEEKKGCFWFLKNTAVLGYAMYKKWRHLNVLDSGLSEEEHDSWLRRWFRLDNMVALGFLMSEEWEKNTQLSPAQFLLNQAISLPNNMLKWNHSWENIVRDKASKAVRVEQALVREGFSRWGILADGRLLDRLLDERRDPNEIRRILDARKESDDSLVEACASNRVQRNGFVGPANGFFYTFDKTINVFIQDFVDKYFKLPDLLWRNKIVSCFRIILICKIAPALAWVLSKGFWNDEHRCDKVKKEMVKSSFYSLKYCLQRYIVGNNREFFDRMKDKTYGLAGPNLVWFLLNEAEPRAATMFANGVSRACGGDGNFLSLKDDYRQKAFVHNLVAYCVRNPCYQTLVKLLRKYSPSCAGWFSEKISGAYRYLVDRGWLSDGLSDLGEIFEVGFGSSNFLMLLYLLIVGRPKKMSEFDRKELIRECQRTGDSSYFFYGLFAYYVADFIGETVANRLVG